MQKDEILERLIKTFEQQGYLNFEQFEVDILKYCKENKAQIKDIHTVNSEIDEIYDKHIECLKTKGYVNFDTKLISDVYSPIDPDLKLILLESGIMQYDVWSFIIEKFNKIKEKYTSASYGISIASKNIEEDFGYINNNIQTCIDISKFIGSFHNATKQFKYLKIQILAAINELEIFEFNVNNIKSVTIVEGAIKKRQECPIFIIDEKMAKDFEIFFNDVFELIYSKQVELRGVLDKGIGYDKKINAMRKSLDRIKYTLKHNNENEDLEYLRQASPEEILKQLTNYDFNYLNKKQDSYELFEKIIIFIIEASSQKNKDEQIKDYKKIVKGAEKIKEGLSSFSDEQQDILKNYEDIKVGIKIGRNQVISAAIDIFDFCYAFDINKTRNLLILFFSKAAQIDGKGNTRMAKNRPDFTLEYGNQLRYLIKNFLL